MGINFGKKVFPNFFVMGFDAPENAKNHLFHVFGMQADYQTPYDVIFHRQLKYFKNQLEWY